MPITLGVERETEPQLVEIRLPDFLHLGHA